MRDKKYLVFCAFVLIFVFCGFSYAALDVKTFNIQQTYFVKDGEGSRYLRGYFELMNNAHNPLQNMEPSQFAATFGKEALPLEEIRSFSSSGEGVGTVFLIDSSKSVSAAQFKAIQYAMRVWVDAMTAEEQVAIVTFGDDVKIVTEFTNDRELLKRLISAISHSGTQTRLNDAIVQAHKVANLDKPGLPARRIIVGLSDGINIAKAGYSKVEVVKELEQNRVPIYFVAYDKPKANAAAKKAYLAGLEDMGLFCRVSGGTLYPEGYLNFTDTYANIHKRIWNAFIFTLNVSKLKGDGNLHHLRLQFTRDGTSINAESDVRFIADESGGDFFSENKLLFLILAAALIAAGIFFLVKNKKDDKTDKSKAGGKTGDPNVPANEKSQTRQRSKDEDGLGSPSFQLEFCEVGDKSNVKHALVLKDRSVIGRGRDSDLVLSDDPAISAKHCEVSMSKGVLYLRDLASTNGTAVNGVPITGLYKLNLNDVVYIGKKQLRLSSVKEI